MPGVRIIKNFGAPCTYIFTGSKGTVSRAVRGGVVAMEREKEKEYVRVREDKREGDKKCVCE